MAKMTKKRLDRYRNSLRLEIACLEEEIWEIETTDKGIGNDVILDYRGGYPQPSSVIGFDWGRYSKKRSLLERKKAELQEVKTWIDQIEDGQTRWVFRMWYGERMSWKKIAIKMGYGGNEDYPRKMIRDKYLDQKNIK